MYTLISTTANRELEKSAEKILKLVQGKQFRRDIDPFCGSGALVIESMRRGLAQEYLANDAFAPNGYILQEMQKDPEVLRAAYNKYHNV
jgi:site-specific DNA-adenine methylase